MLFRNNIEKLSSITIFCNKVDILDIIYLIDHKFKDGPAPDPIESADVNNDGLVDILDIIYLIDFKFKEGPEPACI